MAIIAGLEIILKPGVSTLHKSRVFMGTKVVLVILQKTNGTSID
jgi:hypothetical protein